MENKKITVYTICKNEEHNVDAWMESMKEADCICVLDTGSSDKTYEKLLSWQEKLGDKTVILKQQEIKPWRFDVARNENMKLIPEDTDICICTDLDERLIKGWADDLRNIWTPKTTDCWYKYSWSHNDDGTPGRVFWYNKIHSYGEWNWRFPVHETLNYIGKRERHSQYLDHNKIYLHHYPVAKESRSSYLPLLEQRAEENPNDFSGKIYLAHEYYYNGLYEKCMDFIINKLFVNLDENLEDIYVSNLVFFAGKSAFALEKYSDAEELFKNGIKACPDYRENYIALASLYNQLGKYLEAIEVIEEMFKKSKRFYSWLEWNTSWTYEPYDTLAIAYFYLGNKDVSLNYAKLACMLDTENDYLKKNLKAIEENM